MKVVREMRMRFGARKSVSVVVLCLGSLAAHAQPERSPDPQGSMSTMTDLAPPVGDQAARLGYRAGDTAEATIALGIAAYREGRFAEALVAFEQGVDEGNTSSAIFYNLGNTAYRLGDPSLALAAFRMAQYRSPRDTEVRSNIAFLSKKQGSEGLVPRDTKGEILDWLGLLNLREYLILGSSLWTLFFVGMAVRVLLLGRGGPGYRVSLVGLAMLGCLCFIVTAFGLWVRDAAQPGSRCVTQGQGVALRSEASEASLVLFEIPPVTELWVVDGLSASGTQVAAELHPSLSAGTLGSGNSGGWLRVERGGGLAGWVPAAAVVVY